MRAWVIAAYRGRTLLLAVAVAATLVWIVVDLTLLRGVDVPVSVRLSISASAAIVLVAVGMLSVAGARMLPDVPVRTVQPPVEGRWVGVNSPASAVPSHGTRAYGQAYAIDVVHEPDGPESRPTFGGRAFRAVEEYPAFGKPVLAMVAGTVVSVADSQRDHASRSNMLGMVYLILEGAVRSLGGPRFVVGNHVTVRTTDGVFATVAHLQRGSAAVTVGEEVHAGQQVGRCGNSGNSSEPHVHAQLSDRRSFWIAEGVPVAFSGITVEGADGAPAGGLPENGQAMTWRAPGRGA
ncbi:M23 family metallopeptidase [Corynebacteriaceae bacterium 7-707]